MHTWKPVVVLYRQLKERESQVSARKAASAARYLNIFTVDKAAFQGVSHVLDVFCKTDINQRPSHCPTTSELASK